MEKENKNPYQEEFAPYQKFVRRFYEGVKSGDDVMNLSTDRGCKEYNRILSLEDVPPKDGALVLDVAVGRSRYEDNQFGIADLKIVKADLDPKLPETVERNVLNLSDPDETYDEVWALYLTRYIDMLLPNPLSRKLGMLCEQSGLNYQSVYEKLLTVFGLLALREVLRVIKVGGRVRFGGYIHHFKQGKMLPEFLNGIAL